MDVTRVTQYKPNFFTFIIILLKNMRISPDYELIDVHQFSTYKRFGHLVIHHMVYEQCNYGYRRKMRDFWKWE